MAEKASWSELKKRRGDSVGRRRGYEDAKHSYELGARVRAERERLGLTQSELAEKMGTTRPMIARLEAGG
jgi:ribosome-binding protein aMBF1 (putative translation factor)